MNHLRNMLLLIFCLGPLAAFAQSFSNWIADSKHPELKVRWMIKKDQNNYSNLIVQMQTTKGCRLQITASACQADPKDKNGWKFIQLQKTNTTYQLSYRIMNSCVSGFWWWYKDFQYTAVRFDDN
jgi:hypothetical protein